uniref:Fanconi-associated nuclease n=1 Tax=Tetraodon nigroviridis TaxID=99883 RepID=H3D860_TETNG
NKDKQKRTLTLSKSKKRSSKTTPITSFFNSQPPPKLACPLCGQLVPRFKINEHIDLQCQNFERSEGVSTSASKDLSSVQLSPREKRPKSPKPGQKKDEDDVKEQTSPYFKKNNFTKTSQETTNKRAVRVLDLGSLSAKLSRKRHKIPEATQKVDTHPLEHQEKNLSSEALSSSQKENLLQRYEDTMDCETVTTSSASAAPKIQSGLQTGHNLHHNASGSEEKLVTPNQNSCSTLVKRRATFSSSVTGYQKKGKYDRAVSKTEETTDTAEQKQPKTKDPDSIAAYNRPLCSASDVDAEKVSGDSLQASGVESNPAELDVQVSQPARLPYYLQNFCSVLKAVLENEDDRALFDQQDMSHIQAFEKLSVKAQKLYVRLFQRKLKWLQVNKLDYVEICSDLQLVAEELVRGGLLQSESALQDLAEALDLLPAPELKALAKTFHLGSSGSQKQQVVEGLIKLSRQKSLFSLASPQNNIGTVILKRRAKQLAGSCVRLCRAPRAVFSRVLLLFSLSDSMDEEETAAGGQNQLFTILLVNSGRLAFPDYTVARKAKVFQDREDLIRYEASMRALQDLVLAMQAGQWAVAMDLYSAARSVWQELRESHDLRHQEELPVFLRTFTTGWAYTRILSRGVEILQRLRRYEEAVEELRSLLLQSVYCPDSRGRWWDRLALNLHQHLKEPEQAISAIKDGLSDPLVRTGHKLALYQRAVRLKESASFKKYRLQLQDLPTLKVNDVKHVTIRGQLFPHEGGMGKSMFVIPANGAQEESTNATLLCSVEELSLAHYRQQGFDQVQGIHGEGSTFSALFALLLWDIIFMEGIPDVFRYPYQACPLDLHTDCFYENRREAIDSRVQFLNEAPVETLCSMLEDVWTSQEGKMCSLISWERFSSLQQAQSLVTCWGGAFLGGVIARMSKDYRHCRAGLPDLVVWNTSENTYKLVEVKGPSDRLSQKQQIWLDELQKLGADVEVCHVVATGARGASLD